MPSTSITFPVSVDINDTQPFNECPPLCHVPSPDTPQSVLCSSQRTSAVAFFIDLDATVCNFTELCRYLLVGRMPRQRWDVHYFHHYRSRISLVQLMHCIDKMQVILSSTSSLFLTIEMNVRIHTHHVKQHVQRIFCAASILPI